MIQPSPDFLPPLQIDNAVEEYLGNSHRYQPEGEVMEDVERSAKPFKVNALNAVFLLGTPPLALIGAIWHGYTFRNTWVEGAIFFV